ncbi:enhancer of polycomb-like-domain-containing protein [Chlamydoabsidia padenii]|nr:enhancer of polycomb-like-domain-containing protein [Chlamydoabsidia padenii]
MRPTTRGKKLSPKDRLRIYKGSQLLALDNSTDDILDTADQVKTGLVINEEHDLKTVLSAAQTSVTTGTITNAYIPVPNTSNMIDAEEYSRLYKKKYKEPTTLMRFSSTVEKTTGCPYVMDEEDDAYLKENHTPKSLPEDGFEKLVWEFESITKKQGPLLHGDDSHIPEYEEFLLSVPPGSTINIWPGAPQVFKHWKERCNKRGGQSTIPVLSTCSLSKEEMDPYVCFRRHETNPIRKTRRTEKLALGNLHKLRCNLETARSILEMVIRRERVRKEGLTLDYSLLNMTCKAYDYQRILAIDNDESLNQILSPKTNHGALHAKTGPGQRQVTAHFGQKRRIERELGRKKKQDALYEDLTECSYQPFPQAMPNRFFQQITPSSSEHRQVKLYYPTLPSSCPRYRKRIGRNGRQFIDRVGFRPKQSPASFAGSDEETDEHECYIGSSNGIQMQHQTRLYSAKDLRNLIMTNPVIKETPINGQPRQQERTVLQSSNTNTNLDITRIRNFIDNVLSFTPLSLESTSKRKYHHNRALQTQASTGSDANDNVPTTPLVHESSSVAGSTRHTS